MLLSKRKLLAVLLICVATSTYSQVRMITYYGDTLKGNIKTMTEYTSKGGFPTIKTIYDLDLLSLIERASFYKEEDNTLLGTWVVKYDNYGRCCEANLCCDDNMPCEKSTYQFDDYGRKIAQRYVMCLNTTNSFPSKCCSLTDRLRGTLSNWQVNIDSTIQSSQSIYDNLGRIEELRTENIITGSEYADTTLEIIYFKYRGSDKQVAQTRHEYIKTISGDTTVEITSYKYNSNGKKVEKVVLKTSPPYQTADSTKTLFIYDTYNNLIEEIEYFDIDDTYLRPHSGKHIGAGTEYTYDSLNNITSHTFYQLYKEDNGIETKEVRDSRKIPQSRYNEEDRERKEFDKQGNLVKITHGTEVIFKREIEYF